MRTGRTAGQVICDAIDNWTETSPDEWLAGQLAPGSLTRAVHEALEDEGWLRTPGERLDAALKRDPPVLRPCVVCGTSPCAHDAL